MAIQVGQGARPRRGISCCPAVLGFLWNGPVGSPRGISHRRGSSGFSWFSRAPFSSTRSVIALDANLTRPIAVPGTVSSCRFSRSVKGYHNYHHEFQHDYRNGVKPWNFDPTKWAIWIPRESGIGRKSPSGFPRVGFSFQKWLRPSSARKRSWRKSRSGRHLDAAWKEAAIDAIHHLLERLHEIREELEAGHFGKGEILAGMYRKERRKELLSVLSELAEIRSMRLSSFAAG